jgi:hypothetical protein
VRAHLILVVILQLIGSSATHNGYIEKLQIVSRDAIVTQEGEHYRRISGPLLMGQLQYEWTMVSNIISGHFVCYTNYKDLENHWLEIVRCAPKFFDILFRKFSINQHFALISGEDGRPTEGGKRTFPSESGGDFGYRWVGREIWYNGNCRDFTDIPNIEYKIHMGSAGFINKIPRYIYVSGYPCPLLCVHLVQLYLHDVQLLPKYAASDRANYDKGQSEHSHSPRPSSDHSLIEWVLCCVFLGASAMAVFVAFKSAEYSDDHGSRLWWIPFCGFLVLAFWLAAHAVSIGLPA